MGMTVTQSRQLETPLVFKKGYVRDGSESLTGSVIRSELVSNQQTTSYRSTDAGTDEELAKEWTTTTRNGFRVNSRFDTGHEFHTTRLTNQLSHRGFRFTIPYSYPGLPSPQDYYGLTIDGPLVPNVASQYLDLKIPALTTAEVSTLGPRAIIATAPNRPSANLSTVFGEALTSGLPSGLGVQLYADRASQVPRSASAEYLNAQFGWLPLVNDITKAVRATLKASKVLSQWMRDSDRVVRRRFEFDKTTSWDFNPRVNSGTGTIITGIAGSEGTAFFRGTGSSSASISMEDTKVTKTWFSGAYQYAVPGGSSALEKLTRYESQANHLLGIRLTPDVLWELTPWSWLIDWIGTIGTSLKAANLLGSDGLVVRYGYLMRQTTHQRTFRIHNVSFQGGANVGDVSMRLTRVTKERVRATPYGFNLLPANFTASQWAILGALGLTKGPRSFS